MGEGSRRSRVCQVIGRHINSLYGSYGTVLCGSDSLLQFTHFIGQSRLVTYCGRHTAKEPRKPQNQLGETEDVINEQKHVLIFNITEVLCHGKAERATLIRAPGGSFI